MSSKQSILGNKKPVRLSQTGFKIYVEFIQYIFISPECKCENDDDEIE